MTDEPEDTAAGRATIIDVVFENATEIKTPAPVPEDTGRGGGKVTRWQDGLPQGCPVVPLGKADQTCYYIDAIGQLVELTAGRHGQGEIVGLFGDKIDFLYEHWARTKTVMAEDGHGGESPKTVATGLHYDRIKQDLMSACARKGILDVRRRVRGLGAWADDEGRLVFHCGDALYVSGAPGDARPPAVYEPVDPGEQTDRFIYPAGPPGPMPAEDPAPCGKGSAADRLERALSTWNWRHGAIDVRLLEGWIGAAMVGGALGWRPLVWITGDWATGKSSLTSDRGVIANVLGGIGGGLASADASARGIQQTLGRNSLPVQLDELEAEADNRKADDMVKLARQAASGSFSYRGGADHKSVEFVTRSCFLFSSILVPPLRPQDRSRMAVLDLGLLPQGQKPPKLSDKQYQQIGADIRRRLLDHWPRFQDTWDAYRRALSAAGRGNRNVDVFGTLLACADLLHHDETPKDAPEEWAANLAALEDFADLFLDWQLCLQHVTTKVVNVYNGEARKPLGARIAMAAGRMAHADFGDVERAGREIESFGLKVVDKAPPNGGGVQQYLAVANRHEGLADVFRDTHWFAGSGTSTPWSQTLRRADGSLTANLKFAGVSSRCVLVPIAHVFPRTDEDDAPGPGPAAPTPRPRGNDPFELV